MSVPSVSIVIPLEGEPRLFWECANDVEEASLRAWLVSADMLVEKLGNLIEAAIDRRRP